jgi:hypothetical protein
MGATGARAPAASDREDFIPASMDELAEHYGDYILGMVRKCGIPDQEAADSAQYILERLAKTDVLGQFDPEYVSEHQGRKVRTRFSTFLGAKVIRYCMGERGRLAKRSGHELLIVDAPAEDGAPLLELLGAAGICDDYSGLDMADAITALRAHLAAVPPRSARDTCDLVALFDELVAEVGQDGQFTYAGIQARFGVSGTTAGAWLSRLRQVLAPAAGRPAVAIGGVALSIEQIAEAVKVLRAAPGIMVAQPLAKAGHPLAEAAKGWYHPFAKSEIRKYPAVALPSGSRRGAAGNGHVKTAVIHRLERILAESAAQIPGLPAPETPAAMLPEPEPEKPITPEEEFEARLWRHLSDVAEVDEIKALARRAYEVSAL